MENKWENDLSEILKREIHLQEICEFLKSLKSTGITQNQVRENLCILKEKSGGIIEDRILEVLDVVEGYCNPRYLVW